MYKKLFILLEITFSLTAVLLYFLTTNRIVTLIYGVFALGSAAFLTLFKYRNYENKKNKFNEAVSFINKFIISLSINGSLIDSFNSCKEILNNKLYLELKNIDEVESRIEYLKKYYNYRIFEIFSGVINEYLDKGGDILSYSSTLMSEARRNQANVNNLFTNSVKYLISFISMWIFSFLIVLIAKVSLKDFYNNFVNNQTFIIALTFGFMFFIISFYIYFQSLSLKKFMEEGKYEEN
jgi:hypothetical protein